MIHSSQLGMACWVILKDDQSKKATAGRDLRVLTLLVAAAIRVMMRVIK